MTWQPWGGPKFALDTRFEVLVRPPGGGGGEVGLGGVVWMALEPAGGGLTWAACSEERSRSRCVALGCGGGGVCVWEAQLGALTPEEEVFPGEAE